MKIIKHFPGFRFSCQAKCKQGHNTLKSEIFRFSAKKFRILTQARIYTPQQLDQTIYLFTKLVNFRHNPSEVATMSSLYLAGNINFPPKSSTKSNWTLRWKKGGK